jgi:drug/metabolite transporter (DMT)-like permease
LVRLSVAFVMLVPWLGRLERWSWRLVGFSAGMGIVGYSLPVWLQTAGIGRTTPAIAALTVSAEPLLTIVLAFVLLRTRITRRQKAALLLALVGSWILTGAPRPGHAAHLFGDAALFAALLCFALYNVYSERLLRSVGAGPAAALTFGFGSIGSALIWILTGAPLPAAVSGSLLWSLGYMALGATGLAYLFWLIAVGRQSVTVATLFLYTQPLIGSLLSCLLGQSRITENLAVGGILVIAAMTLGQNGLTSATTTPPSDQATLTGKVN